MSIRERMEILEGIAEQTFKKIQALREICKHPTYEIKLYSWRPGRIDPRKICEDCHAVIGAPETEEDKEIGDRLMAPLTVTAVAHTMISKDSFR